MLHFCYPLVQCVWYQNKKVAINSLQIALLKASLIRYFKFNSRSFKRGSNEYAKILVQSIHQPKSSISPLFIGQNVQVEYRSAPVHGEIIPTPPPPFSYLFLNPYSVFHSFCQTPFPSLFRICIRRYCLRCWLWHSSSPLCLPIHLLFLFVITNDHVSPHCSTHMFFNLSCMFSLCRQYNDQTL